MKRLILLFLFFISGISFVSAGDISICDVYPVGSIQYVQCVIGVQNENIYPECAPYHGIPVWYSVCISQAHTNEFAPGTCYDVSECIDRCNSIVFLSCTNSLACGSSGGAPIANYNLNSCQTNCSTNSICGTEVSDTIPAGLPSSPPGDCSPKTYDDGRGSGNFCTKEKRVTDYCIHNVCGDLCDGKGNCNYGCRDESYVCGGHREPDCHTCTRRSGRHYNLDPCEVNNPWNGGSITCTSMVRYVDDYKSCTYDAGSICPASSGCPSIPMPKPVDHWKCNDTITVDYQGHNCNQGNLYANYSDNCSANWRINTSGVQAGSTRVNGLESYVSNFRINVPGLYLDQLNNQNPYSDTLGIPTMIVGVGSVFGVAGIKSPAPGSAGGTISFDIVNRRYNNTSTKSDPIQLYFMRPVKGIMDIYDNNSISNPLLGLEQTLRLTVNRLTSLANSSSFNILRYQETLNTDNSAYSITNKTIRGSEGESTNNLLNFIVNYISSGIIPTNSNIFGFKTEPYVNYTIGGFNVTYRLSVDGLPTSITPITMNGGTYNGIKILGYVQAQGRQNTTIAFKKTSTLSTAQIRSKIKSRVAGLIKGMKSGTTQNGLKYIDLNGTSKKLSDIFGSSVNLNGVKTLILRNGNLLIDANFDSQLGIIMIRDGAKEKDSRRGNVFIHQSVSYINTLIYADGSLISAYFTSGWDASGYGYNTTTYVNSQQRTKELTNQLVIKGALFTRNTIGGSILTDQGKYILPGGEKAPDTGAGWRNLATMYDLNFFRSYNYGWNGINATRNKGYSNPLVFIYDPTYEKKPPIGFDF